MYQQQPQPQQQHHLHHHHYGPEQTHHNDPTNRLPHHLSQAHLDNDLKADFGIIEILSCVLTELCEKQGQNPKPCRNKFSAQNAPGITIYQYLTRIDKYSSCSKECFVLALIYIDRIIQTNPTFLVSNLNIHRLLITAVMLAAKFFDDQYYNNTYYARVGGVDAGEINQLEVEFLFMTNFSLYVPLDTYREYFMELRSHSRNHCANCQKLADTKLQQQQQQHTVTQATPSQQQAVQYSAHQHQQYPQQTSSHVPIQPQQHPHPQNQQYYPQ